MCVYVYHIFFSQSFADGLLCWFHTLATMDNAVIHVDVNCFIAHIVISFLKSVHDGEEGNEEGASWCYAFGEERAEIKK